jgi:hypothetical protein
MRNASRICAERSAAWVRSDLHAVVMKLMQGTGCVDPRQNGEGGNDDA